MANKGADELAKKLTRVSSVNRRILAEEEKHLWDNLNNNFRSQSDEDQDEDEENDENDENEGDENIVVPTELSSEESAAISRLSNIFDATGLTQEESRKLVAVMYFSPAANRDEAKARELLQAARAKYDAERDDEGEEDGDDDGWEDAYECNNCHKDIDPEGDVYHCSSCEDFDLCEDCMNKQRESPFHAALHTFERVVQESHDAHATKPTTSTPPAVVAKVEPAAPAPQQQPQPQQPSPPLQVSRQLQQHEQQPTAQHYAKAASTEGSNTTLLIGGVVLISAAAVGYYMWRRRQ